MSKSNDNVRIVEVGPRDGLQNVKNTVPLSIKLELIKRLQRTGLNSIEITSIVSPRAIPQLADCRQLLSEPDIQALVRNPALRFPVLVPNLKGLQIAIDNNVREVALFVSASEGFSKANINCSVEQGLQRAGQVAREALAHGVAIRGYISCIFACPYDGPTPHSAVLHCVRRLIDIGCYEISLGDTVGIGVAPQVKALVNYLTEQGVPIDRLAGHFHDTYGQAVSNVQAAYECGVRVFDSSVAGLGGCPFAPGAKGNVATEDLVYLFHQAGISTGVNLQELVKTGVWISQQLSKQNESRAGSALATKLGMSAVSDLSLSDKKAIALSLQWQFRRQTDGLQIYRSGPNVKVILDRPKNGNALTVSMISDLTALFEEAANDRTISRIVLTGRGKFFCTGMDLAKDSTSVGRKKQSSSAAQFDRLTYLFETIDNAPQVTIAGIQGPAFGGGVGLAFACDIRIATKEANMTLSEIKLGLCPATISKYIFREWGLALTREAMLSGRAVNMDELVRVGVVKAKLANNETELAASLDECLNALRFTAPRASTMCKTLAHLSWKHSGASEQSEGIRTLFLEMMAKTGEAAFGVEQFQSGSKQIDWDAYLARATGPKI